MDTVSQSLLGGCKTSYLAPVGWISKLHHT